MSGRLVVNRYALALLETAEKAGSLEVLREDMEVIDKLLKEVPSIRRFCLDLHSSRAVEFEFVKIALIPYVEELTARLILTIVENGRLAAIPFIPTAVRELLEQKEDIVTVVMETANEPDEDIVDLVKSIMSERTTKKVLLQIKIVPWLLGGFRILWQNRMIDMSVRYRLKKVRALLKQE